VSTYFKFRIPTAVHIAQLQNVVNGLSGEYAVCGDVNAASEIWFSGRTDGKGERVEAFIRDNDLSCLNSLSVYHTFVGARGIPTSMLH